MWYGQQAFAEVDVTEPLTFFTKVDKGYRPKDVEGKKKPPFRWKRLMENCWNEDPEERPFAWTCHEQITTLSQAVVRP